MALVHIPVEDELHARIRAKVKTLRKEGRKVTWATLFAEWGKQWVDPLKTNSPSKVMAVQGGHLAAGAAMGVDVGAPMNGVRVTPTPVVVTHVEVGKVDITPAFNVDHKPGCGKGGRGCVRDCHFFDPTVDE